MNQSFVSDSQATRNRHVMALANTGELFATLPRRPCEPVRAVTAWLNASHPTTGLANGFYLRTVRGSWATVCVLEGEELGAAQRQMAGLVLDNGWLDPL